MSQRASWDWKEVCGRSIPQLEQGSKRPAGFEVCSPMEGQAHRRSGVACILDIGKIRGGGHPLSPRRGLWKREKGLVPGKTKSDAAEVAGIRHEADDAEPPGGAPPSERCPTNHCEGCICWQKQHTLAHSRHSSPCMPNTSTLQRYH